MFISNDTTSLIKNFLNGDNYTTELAEKVFATFDLIDERKYLEVLNIVKSFLNTVEKEIYEDLYLIYTDKDLTTKEIALIVRMINLCHRDKYYFILINNKLIYCNTSYEDFDESVIIFHINKVIKDKEFFEKINSFKKDVKSKTVNKIKEILIKFKILNKLAY